MANKLKIPGIIDYMRHWWIYAVLSGLIIIPGCYYFLRFGLKPSIDFTGGTLLEIATPQSSRLNNQTILSNTTPGVEISSIQSTGAHSYLIKMKPIDKNQATLFKNKLASASGILTASVSATAAVQELRFETVGPILGQELLTKTYIAIVLAALSIMGYLAYRFKNLKYGISAIVSMLHDSLILLSIFAILGHFWGIEVDTLFVTAMLTTLSFSVHDTVVVYNRIRESEHQFPSVDYVTLVNKSVTETLARSINNSMTIIFMLLALLLFGGVTIRWFVFALLIGIVTGTYSSPFVAGPLLVLWDKLFKRNSA